MTLPSTDRLTESAPAGASNPHALLSVQLRRHEAVTALAVIVLSIDRLRQQTGVVASWRYRDHVNAIADLQWVERALRLAMGEESERGEAQARGTSEAAGTP